LMMESSTSRASSYLNQKTCRTNVWTSVHDTHYQITYNWTNHKIIDEACSL
jgi:hypothetical protein